MAVKLDTSDRRFEMVTSIAIKIGNEEVAHDFGRQVTMQHARKLAQHFLDVLTGEQSSLSVNEEPRP